MRANIKELTNDLLFKLGTWLWFKELTIVSDEEVLKSKLYSEFYIDKLKIHGRPFMENNNTN